MPMKTSALNSMSSKRSPAACFTHASFSSARSAVPSCPTSALTSPGARFGLIPTMSASRAAMDSIRFPPAPMRIGGCGFWTGFGKPS